MKSFDSNTNRTRPAWTRNGPGGLFYARTRKTGQRLCSAVTPVQYRRGRVETPAPIYCVCPSRVTHAPSRRFCVVAVCLCHNDKVSVCARRRPRATRDSSARRRPPGSVRRGLQPSAPPGATRQRPPGGGHTPDRPRPSFCALLRFLKRSTFTRKPLSAPFCFLRNFLLTN